MSKNSSTFFLTLLAASLKSIAAIHQIGHTRLHMPQDACTRPKSPNPDPRCRESGLAIRCQSPVKSSTEFANRRGGVDDGVGGDRRGWHSGTERVLQEMLRTRGEEQRTHLNPNIAIKNHMSKPTGKHAITTGRYVG